MRTYAVYLRPRGTLASEIGSDTLFGAICWAIRTLYGAGRLTEMLLGFNDCPPFVLSSAFPYLHRGGAKVRFFPRPLLADLKSEQVNRLAEGRARPTDWGPLAHKHAVVEVIDRAKKLEVPFISERLFERIVRGQIDTEALLRRLVKRGTSDDDIEWVVEGALITKGERERIDPEMEHWAFWQAMDVQHNQIDRVAGATVEGRLFFIKETTFAHGLAGLWFALRTDELDFLRPALRYLEDTGIGGKRTVGKGHFAIEGIEETRLPEAEDGFNAFVSLSRYLPADGECDFGQRPLSYALAPLRPKHEARLTGRGHRIYKGLLRAFEPGSIFPAPAQKNPYYGRITSVGENAEEGGWEVWHNGMTIPVFAEVRDEVR
jgi:CRISPR-associated protein Csm4